MKAIKKENRSIFILLLIAAFTYSCSKQLQRTIVSFPEFSENILIHSSKNVLGPSEPTICIDPSNTSRVIAGSVLDNVYVSNDGGRTWDVKRLKSKYGVYGDPVIRIDNTGKIYYAHLSNPKGKAYRDDSFLDRIVIQRSDDGGKNWNDGGHTEIRGSHDQDKEWLYIDPNDGTILMSWTEFDKYNSSKKEDRSRILFSKSTDHGDTWTKPVVISQFEGDCLDDDMTTEGAVPVIGIDGTYYIVWAFDSKIFLDMSFDKGKTWLKEDKVIASQVNGWSQTIPGILRCNGMPFIKSDLSDGPFKGRLYVNWSDQKNGDDDTDIWVIYSDNQGLSWSTPTRVNNDAPGNQQFFPNMAVDPITGVVYVIFYDRRNSNSHETDVFLAFSLDGGNTFTNRKLTERPFIPEKTIFFGDYTDISVYNNIVRPIWTEYKRGELSVWTSIIDMDTKD